MMLCCIPFFAGDVHQAIRLLRWIVDLGGCEKHDCLLVADADTPWDEVLKCRAVAVEGFRDVMIDTNGEHVEGWIPGSNSLFKVAAEWAQQNVRPFLFLEPDAVPLVAGWLDRIDEAYLNDGHPFMGSVVHHGYPDLPSPYFEGVAVYPHDAWRRMSPLFHTEQSWTYACAAAVVPQALNSALFQHLWGEMGNPPTFAEKNILGTNVFCLEQVKIDAVVFHRNKDGTLIRLLRKRLGLLPPEKTFCHGGDVGDLVYGLCAILAAGGGALYLVPHAVREAFTPAKADLILPLIRSQPYITFASFEPGPIIPFGSKLKPDFVEHDLNQFRPLQFSRRGKHLWENIAATHLRLLGLDLNIANRSPWLTVGPVKIPGKTVIFHRSPRYHNPWFPWKAIWRKYALQAVFIGTRAEHSQFVREVGGLPFHETRNFLEVAQVIQGCRLFVGNQSAPYAIAEGLKQNAILESCPGVPDCQFKRDNLQNAMDGRIQLPNL